LFGLNCVGRAGQPLAVFAGVSCRSLDAFWIFARSSGEASSCAMRLRTTGVYGAAGSIGGELVDDGSGTGNE
jgi:hypothetical protein